MRLPIASLIIAISIGLSVPALAQGKKGKKTPKAEAAKESSKKERAQGEALRVMILKFETFKTPSPVMDNFYASMEAGFKAAPGLVVARGGEVTLNDLVITLGCDGATKECLIGLQDFVEADRIVFGSVQTEGDIYLFNIRVFDFAQGDFIARLEDQTIEGDEAKLKAAIPALVESVIYGNVGKISVVAQGADAPEVFFDGKKVGRAPIDLDALPLGEHNIMVKDSRGIEQTQTVLLRRDAPAQLTFSFGGEVAAPGEVGETSSPLIIPGWVAVGVGVAGTAFGVYNQLELGAQEDAALNFKGQTSANASEAGDIRDRYDKMQGHHTNRLIGYTIGGVGLIAGVTMLVMAYTGGEEAAPMSSGIAPQPKRAKLPVQIMPTNQGVQIGIDF